MDDDVSRFAQTFQTFMEKMSEAAWAGKPSPVRDLLDRHLGADSSQLPVVSETFETYDHANVQVGLSAYLEAEGRSHDLVGLTGQQRHFESLSDLLHTSHMAGVGIGSVDLVNLPVSPDETLACVQFGIFLIDDGETRLAVLMRGPTEFGPRPSLSLEVLCADQDRARALLAEVRRLTLERNVFRRQVISFGEADADVAFLLTTNRADALEPALAARPGRVDLALELDLPDADARRRLMDLYGRGLELHVEDLTPVIERTEGVAASFIKELMRRAALLATDESDGIGPLVVTDVHIRSALDEFLDERDSLTQRLLGGPGGRHEPPRPGTEWLVAGGAETPV